MYRSLQASAFITGCGKASQVSLNLQARSTAQAVGQPEPPLETARACRFWR